MSSLPGGAASKLGNRYEAWWTLYRLADLLHDRADRMRIEPPGPAGIGVEFWVDEGATRWCEQVKHAGAKNWWTIGRLLQEDVLTKLVSHLAAGHQVRLVLSRDAPDLERLTNKARAAETFGEYRQVLAGDQRPHFERVALAWQVPHETAWSYLTRVTVTHEPRDHLRDLVRLTYEVLVEGDPELVVNELRGWLDDKLHRTITAPMVWHHLEAKGFTRRLLAGDPAITRGLADTMCRHRRLIDSRLPAAGAVSQPMVSSVVKTLTVADGPQILVLHGRAGSGKSTIAADAVDELTGAGWFAGVASMDKAAADERSAATLGRRLGLPGSPVTHLTAAANASPAVLLIDQLDAVSTYSGRMPDAFEAVAEVLEQATAFPELRVMLVVRTVDLEEDPRLRSVCADELHVGTVMVDELAEVDVREYLRAIGVDVSSLPATTVALLRVPLHLAIFSQLSVGSRQLPYRTLSDLYARFTSEVRRDIEREVGALDWPGITGALVNYMSDREQLYAPAAVLDFAAAREVAALRSHNILLADEGRVEFFHETYFDFVFARAFVAAGRDLHGFLTGSSQALFRRAQVRQVLEYLAATDQGAFRSAATRLLRSTDIRRHLRDVVVTVLRQLNAEPSDWRAIESLGFDDGPLHAHLASLLTTPAWFDAADAAERWPALLSETSTVDRAAHQLIIAARHHPERVAELVRPYLGANEQWRLRLRAVVQWSLRPGLVDLTVELIARGDLDDVRGPIAVNSDFWSLLHLLENDDPNGAVRLIGAHLQRALVRAAVDGSSDPFTTGHLSDHSSAGGNSTITKVAKKAPSAFVREALPFVVAVACEPVADDQGGLSRSPRWGWRYVESRLGVDDAIFSGVDDALRSMAKTHPEKARAAVAPLATRESAELRFLACRTFAAAQPGDADIDWLLTDGRNLALGWADSPRWASRELVEAASVKCNDERLRLLIDVLLDYYPAWERSTEGRRARGFAQYELLTAIPRHRLCDSAVKRLAELARKFADHPPRRPEPIEVKTVPAPIEPRAVEYMSDEDWLRAMATHDRDRLTLSQGEFVGGAAELANLVRERAEQEPARFARIALELGDDTSPVYLSRIIEAVARGVSVDELGRLCRHGRSVVGQAVGRSICHAIANVSGDVTDLLIELLTECASDDDPVTEVARMAAENGQYYYAGDLAMAGLNCTRGAAAETIGRVLILQPGRADQLLPTVTRLAGDPILAVRSMAASAVRALMNTRREDALNLASGLFAEQPDDLFTTSPALRLLRDSLLRQPERFTPFLQSALQSTEDIAEGAGAVWAAALMHELIRPPVTTDLGALSAPARRGAANWLARNVAMAPDMVVELFGDADESVQAAAAAAVREVAGLDKSIAQMIVSEFTASQAFESGYDQLLHVLADSSHILPEAAMAACERAVEVGGRDLGDIRTRHAGASDDLIKVVLRLYRQGNAHMRERCLDLIDRLSEVGAYGLHDTLEIDRMTDWR